MPEIQVREMESVLQVASGQTVILGGLMQDNTRFDRQQIPGMDHLGPAGDVGRFRDERAAKTELVIFLRPTVVSNASLDSDELKMFRRYLPQPDPAQARQAPPASTAPPMSVLMKALEKAAQDRDKTPVEPSLQGGELSLETIDTKPAAAGRDHGANAASTGNTAAAGGKRSAAQTQAATVMSAYQPAGRDIFGRLRDNPWYVIGTIIGLCVLAYGVYFYVQITHPGWLIKSPPPVAAKPKLAAS
ncbi:MAG: hypothetical protein FJY56_22570, partial [Betaproteobacteria bacterium]|nr:hypothetical protein [Betaproteobacteria bacterium]